MRKVFLVIVVTAIAACSSSSNDESAPVAPPDDAGEEASTSEPVAEAGLDSASPVDAAALDAALPVGESVSVESSKTPMSCDAICSAKKYTCGSTTCPSLGGALGIAAYLGGNSSNLACADVPPADNGGESFTRVDCCCIMPFVIVTGPTPSKSCDDVCAAHSLKCDDTHAWDPAGKGGQDAQYERPSTTVVTDYAFPCTKVPTATIPLLKPTEKGTLSKYSCACVAP